MLSLLAPPEATATRVPLSERTVHDLDLASLARSTLHQGINETAILRILCELPRSEDVIRYRQETARIFWNTTRFCAAMTDLVRAMQELTLFARGGHETDRPLLEAIWRLGELELYVDLVRRTHDLLANLMDISTGLALLRDELEGRLADPGFAELERELPQLRAGIKLHQSVTVGINLDDKLRPVEAALLRLNDRPFREGHFLSGFLGRSFKDEFATITPLSRNQEPDDPLRASMQMPLAPLFEELDSLLRAMLRPLAQKLRSYVAVNTELFRRLYPEIAFYLGTTAYLRSIADAGFPVSFPDILPPSRRVTAFKGLYNLRLASHWATSKASHSMVGNEVRFDDAARLYLLTGPNGGGKTTFTQAVGIATVLGQLGLPVPASAAELSPVDTIATHFPAEEEFDDELGHFEDEARRISELFDEVSAQSMVLMNEPLASTGPREAEQIAEAVITALARAGVRGVVTTHYHDLAHAADRLTAGAAVDSGAAVSRIGTLSAGVRVEDGKARRTYEITTGPPAGSSFAEDVARRYRIDDASLRERLRSSDGEQPNDSR